ncbi:MAG: hypothetical protein IKW06_03740 [Clostridia bacterium]|nr:hypothetical protein [Clostridia bacterium]
MNNKRKNIITTFIFSFLLLCISVLCIVKPAEVFSESERRELASFPNFSVSTFASGEFAQNFETYATERFPYRDMFRSVKAWFSKTVFKKLDNNGLFVAEGHISKLDSEENPQMMDHAAERFAYLYNTYMKDKNTNVYFSVIPDKNFLLASPNGYPSLDYRAFTEKIKEKTSYMTYIDVTDLLGLEDYYTTDSHWRQEKIIDIAEKIGTAMGVDVSAAYKENKLDYPFYGVYAGQLALPTKSDEIVYLTNDTLDACCVTYYDTGIGKEGLLYNMEKAYGKDPYEMFLSGTTPLVTIENPNAKTDKELVIFRDSFGSSLAPLLAEGYAKITVVDIRYVQSAFVGNLVEFENCDVLFVYSTSLLNNSLAMR